MALNLRPLQLKSVPFSVVNHHYSQPCLLMCYVDTTGVCVYQPLTWTTTQKVKSMHLCSYSWQKKTTIYMFKI